MIALRGIRKRFGTREVLRGVDLDVREGRVTALIGPNGSGKTTLLKLVLGLARADSGTIEVDGELVDADGRYRSALGYMPQIARFPEHLRVRHLIDTVVALRRGVGRDENLIAELGIGAELDKPLGALSGGTRQKVNAVIALMFRPDILILDEPTAGLDPVASRQLKQRIRRMRAAGCTIVITSHVLSELEELADDVAFLHDGTIQFASPLRSLLTWTAQSRLEDAIAVLMDPARAVKAPATPKLVLLRNGSER